MGDLLIHWWQQQSSVSNPFQSHHQRKRFQNPKQIGEICLFTGDSGVFSERMLREPLPRGNGAMHVLFVLKKSEPLLANLSNNVISFYIMWTFREITEFKSFEVLKNRGLMLDVGEWGSDVMVTGVLLYHDCFLLIQKVVPSGFFHIRDLKWSL